MHRFALGGYILQKTKERMLLVTSRKKDICGENQDGGVGRHTAPPHTTRTDRELNSKGDQHQGNRK